MSEENVAAMSEESTTPDLVELTRRLYEAANAGDFDAITSFYGPDSVWDQPDGIATFEGEPAIRRFVEDWQGSYEEYAVEVEEIVDLGGAVTFAISAQKGRPLASGGDVQIRFAAVHLWADGLIVRMTTYGDLDQGRAAAEQLAAELK
jgi:ketosteroid isomerase-like protein